MLPRKRKETQWKRLNGTKLLDDNREQESELKRQIGSPLDKEARVAERKEELARLRTEIAERGKNVKE